MGNFHSRVNFSINSQCFFRFWLVETLLLLLRIFPFLQIFPISRIFPFFRIFTGVFRFSGFFRQFATLLLIFIGWNTFISQYTLGLTFIQINFHKYKLDHIFEFVSSLYSSKLLGQYGSKWSQSKRQKVTLTRVQATMQTVGHNRKQIRLRRLDHGIP